MAIFYRKILIVFSISLLASFLSGQQDSLDTIAYQPQSFKVIALNVSPLAYRLIPFNNNIPGSGPIDLAYAWGVDQHEFRLGVGFDLNPDSETNRGMLRLGYGRQIAENKSFNFYSNYDVMLGGGTFNFSDSPGDGDGILGIAFGAGIRYFISKNIFLNVESSLFIGNTGGLSIKILPPVALFFGVKI